MAAVRRPAPLTASVTGTVRGVEQCGLMIIPLIMTFRPLRMQALSMTWSMRAKAGIVDTERNKD